MPEPAQFYETQKVISEYLLFHYGEGKVPTPPGLQTVASDNFPSRCARLAQRHPAPRGRALDLGCAVGRATCELSALFEEAVGIDYSHGLIDAAQRLAAGETLEAEIADEGELTQRISLRLPPVARPEKLRFFQGDAMRLPEDLGVFDFALLANLIDRLPDPRACLVSMAKHVRSGGLLAITSPYTWMEDFTPRSNWLGGFMRENAPVRTLDTLRSILPPNFDFLEAIDMPFLIREHSRKNQYSVAQASLWRRR